MTTGAREMPSAQVPTAPVPAASPEPRWDLAFIGVLGYLIVEYMRLTAQYQILLPLQLGKVVIAISALGLALSPRVRGGDRSIVRATDIALVLLLLGGLLSTLAANHLDLAWPGYVDLLKWAVIYFLIGRIVTSSWRFRIFIFLFLLLNLKMAQHEIRYFYASRAYWGEMVAIGQDAGAGSTGFFANSADFGVAMCVVWPMAVTLLFAKPKKIWQLLLVMCSAVFLVAILVCGSRGALVGAACVTLAGMVASRRKLAAVLMAVLLIPGIVFVLPGASKQRFQSAWQLEGDKTATSRLVFWKAGIRMFRDDPLLGVGIKNFPVTRLEEYSQLGETTKAYVPHSIYIEVLSELGLAGSIPALALFMLPFRLNARTRKLLLALGAERRRSFEYCLSLGLDLALVGYLSSGAFVAVFYYPHLWVLLGLSVGLYTACCHLQPRPTLPNSFPVEQSGQLQMAAPSGGS
jgi:putative inorganic carbon (HCO3(-)) transporter